MIGRDQILAFLGAPQYRPMRRRELARALEATGGEDYQEFRRALGELEADGLVTLLRGRRYALADRRRETGGVVGTFISKGAFGFVRPDAGGEDFYIPGAHLGGAMSGDRVLVEPRSGRGPRRSGRIVKVLERHSQEIVGLLRAGPGGPFILPGERASEEGVEVAAEPGLRDSELPVGHKVAARILRYPTASRPALAELVADLGAAGTVAAETAAVIREFGLREQFPPEAQAEAAALPAELPAGELGRRADYRAQSCVTIDPVDAADFDDAVYLERSEDGWRLYVHIADVGWYLPAGGALDAEARARGNSVYLPGKVLPMLPPRLSSDLCSLRPGQDRAAQTAVLDFGPGGERRGARIQRSVIRSAARLNYDQVRRLLTGQAGPDDEVPAPTLALLSRMRDFSQQLRALRFAAGALFLDVPEIRVRVGADGETLAVEERRQDFSHQLIEEFMLAANRAVAERLLAAELPGIFRVHEDPDEESLEQLARFLKSHQIILKPPYTRRKLQQAIESARGKPCYPAVSFAALTSLKQARYSAQPAAHYALAFEPYCHFTSPIRRYPDLVVHRGLAGLYPPGGAELPELARGGRRKGARAPVEDRRRAASWMEATAVHASLTERRADEAERRLTRFRQLELLKRAGGGEHGGIITGVAEFGFFVRLDEFLVEGLVHVSSLVDRYHYLAHRQELAGMRTGRRWRLGDRVAVRVLRLDPATGRLELEPAGNS